MIIISQPVAAVILELVCSIACRSLESNEDLAFVVVGLDVSVSRTGFLEREAAVDDNAQLPGREEWERRLAEPPHKISL